jgi:pimeloyl-ACP methyl ester carboxylesterase
VWEESLAIGVDSFSAELSKLFEPSLSGYKVRRLSGDFDAFIAMNSAMKDYPGFDDKLPALAMPCLLIAGDADGNYSRAKDCAKNIPNAEFVSLPGLDHVQAFVRSDLVIPHVKKFLVNVDLSI